MKGFLIGFKSLNPRVRSVETKRKWQLTKNTDVVVVRRNIDGIRNESAQQEYVCNSAFRQCTMTDVCDE